MRYMSSLLVAASVLSSGLVFSAEEGTTIKEQNSDRTADLVSHRTITREVVQKTAHNNSDVMKQYDVLAQTLQDNYSANGGLSDKDVHRILDAIAFAAEKHSPQTRKDIDQHPYIIHPMGVTCNLIVIGKVRDADVIIAALLHDTIEDTQTTFEEIKGRFGSRVEGLVREVTNDKSLPQKERKRLQIVNAPHKSKEAAQIKLSDKLHNLTDLAKFPPPDWDRGRIDAYFLWAKTVVDNLPAANAPLKQAVDAVIEGYWQKQAAVR